MHTNGSGSKCILKREITVEVQRGLGVKILTESFELLDCRDSWGAIVEVLWKPFRGSSVRSRVLFYVESSEKTSRALYGLEVSLMGRMQLN